MSQIIKNNGEITKITFGIGTTFVMYSSDLASEDFFFWSQTLKRCSLGENFALIAKTEAHYETKANGIKKLLTAVIVVSSLKKTFRDELYCPSFNRSKMVYRIKRFELTIFKTIHIRWCKISLQRCLSAGSRGHD